MDISFRKSFKESKESNAGDLQLGLKYDDSRFKFIVNVIAAR